MGVGGNGAQLLHGDEVLLWGDGNVLEVNRGGYVALPMY